MNVVFTGPAFTSSGQSVVRSDLTYACTLKGNITVQGSVRADTDMVVASRVDTVKALNASMRGLAVLTYPEFITKFLRGIDIKTGGKPNKYIDAIQLDMLVPDFTGTFDLQAMDAL